MNCPTCGSPMAHFKNPDRDVCPTPERHRVSTTLGRQVGGRSGTSGAQRRVRQETRKRERDEKGRLKGDGKDKK